MSVGVDRVTRTTCTSCNNILDRRRSCQSLVAVFARICFTATSPHTRTCVRTPTHTRTHHTHGVTRSHTDMMYRRPHHLIYSPPPLNHQRRTNSPTYPHIHPLLQRKSALLAMGALEDPSDEDDEYFGLNVPAGQLYRCLSRSLSRSLSRARSLSLSPSLALPLVSILLSLRRRLSRALSPMHTHTHTRTHTLSLSVGSFSLTHSLPVLLPRVLPCVVMLGVWEL